MSTHEASSDARPQIDLKVEAAAFAQLGALLSSARAPGTKPAALDAIMQEVQGVEAQLEELKQTRRQALSAIGLEPQQLLEGLMQLSPGKTEAALKAEFQAWGEAAKSASKQVQISEEFFRVASGAVSGVLDSLQGRGMTADIYGKHGMETMDGRARWLSTVT